MRKKSIKVVIFDRFFRKYKPYGSCITKNRNIQDKNIIRIFVQTSGDALPQICRNLIFVWDASNN